MTSEECRLVQASFAQVDPIADEIAASFYGRLFELDASLALLFKADLKIQGTKFMEKLAIAVKGLEDVEAITPFVEVLGRRHARYGARAKDYDTLGDALLWALEQEPRPALAPEVIAAWSAAYKLISDVMIEAAKSHASS